MEDANKKVVPVAKRRLDREVSDLIALRKQQGNDAVEVVATYSPSPAALAWKFSGIHSICEAVNRRSIIQPKTRVSWLGSIQTIVSSAKFEYSNITSKLGVFDDHGKKMVDPRSRKRSMRIPCEGDVSVQASDKRFLETLAALHQMIYIGVM